MQFLEDILAHWEGVVDEDSVGLRRKSGPHGLVDGSLGLQGALDNVPPTGFRIHGQDRNDYIRVQRVDSPDHLFQAVDSDGGRVHCRNRLAIVADIVGIALLGIIDPIREHSDLALAGIYGDVGGLHIGLATHSATPIGVASPSIGAGHLVAKDIPEAGIIAIVLGLVTETPTGPSDLADARCLQVLEIVVVVTDGNAHRVTSCIWVSSLDHRHAVPKALQLQVQLVGPSLPRGIAAPDYIELDLAADRDLSALLLDEFGRDGRSRRCRCSPSQTNEAIA
mmetsp:Transcript_93716/g.201129  ORF Transcript_93716/g.201129 Transcript_93716/m.201129 type:complete len:280 (+) Transcript_93716:258-1097(+)